jgi:hypothetical protein
MRLLFATIRKTPLFDGSRASYPALVLVTAMERAMRRAPDFHPVFSAPHLFSRGTTKCKTSGASRREKAKSYLSRDASFETPLRGSSG